MVRPVSVLVGVLLVACQGRGTLELAEVPTQAKVGSVEIRGFGQPVSDAEICVLDLDRCVTTGSDGAFAIDLPLDQETAVLVTHPDLVPVLVPLVTGGAGDGPDIDLALWSVGTWDELLFIGNVTWLPGTGAMQVEARQRATPPAVGQPDPGASEVAVELDLEGARVRYLDDDGRFVDGSLDRTAGSGTALFFDLPEAERVVELMPPSGSCGPREYGWQDGRAPVLADRVTLVVQACAPAR